MNAITEFRRRARARNNVTQRTTTHPQEWLVSCNCAHGTGHAYTHRQRKISPNLTVKTQVTTVVASNTRIVERQRFAPLHHKDMAAITNATNKRGVKSVLRSEYSVTSCLLCNVARFLAQKDAVYV